MLLAAGRYWTARSKFYALLRDVEPRFFNLDIGRRTSPTLPAGEKLAHLIKSIRSTSRAFSDEANRGKEAAELAPAFADKDAIIWQMRREEID